MTKLLPATICAACLGAAVSASALDYVTLRRDGKTISVQGRLVLTAEDGGILLIARDGVLWNIVPEEQVKHTSDDLPFKPLAAPELSKSLLGCLPAGFRVHQTAHYVILYDTSRAYAQWCGGVFEGLYTAFHTFWTRKEFELAEPEFPLVAVVFAEKASYLKFAESELGEARHSIIGYYSLATNRMTMYDLTGTNQGRGGRGGTYAEVQRILASSEAARTVSTIVHEATHQIAFNCGMHARYSDCPLWFSEGVAIYFETPNLRSAKGWSGVGMLNRSRLTQFQKYLGLRPADSLQTLIATDKRFRDVKQAPDAYAEAWALTYFLQQRRAKQYVEYLKALSEKKPLIPDEPEKRLAQFETCFGDTKKLDAEFLKYMGRLR